MHIAAKSGEPEDRDDSTMTANLPAAPATSEAKLTIPEMLRHTDLAETFCPGSSNDIMRKHANFF